VLQCLKGDDERAKVSYADVSRGRDEVLRGDERELGNCASPDQGTSWSNREDIILDRSGNVSWETQEDLIKFR